MLKRDARCQTDEEDKERNSLLFAVAVFAGESFESIETCEFARSSSGAALVGAAATGLCIGKQFLSG